MNHNATSREELLDASLRLASKEGIGTLNIRDLAGACNVSVGCVYRYFPSKAALVSAVVEKIWEQIFHMTENSESATDFREQTRRFFDCIRDGSAEYPAFFRQHAASFRESEKGEGRQVMNRYLDRARDFLASSLDKDPAVRADVFDEDFTRGAFIDFVFDNLLLLEIQQADSCDYLIRLIEKLIY